MRKDLPPTEAEHPLLAGAALRSRTDFKGRIVYADRAFVDVCGIPSEELVGAPYYLAPAERLQDQAGALLHVVSMFNLPPRGEDARIPVAPAAPNVTMLARRPREPVAPALGETGAVGAWRIR